MPIYNTDVDNRSDSTRKGTGGATSYGADTWSPARAAGHVYDTVNNVINAPFLYVFDLLPKAAQDFISPEIPEGMSIGVVNLPSRGKGGSPRLRLKSTPASKPVKVKVLQGEKYASSPEYSSGSNRIRRNSNILTENGVQYQVTSNKPGQETVRRVGFDRNAPVTSRALLRGRLNPTKVAYRLVDDAGKGYDLSSALKAYIDRYTLMGTVAPTYKHQWMVDFLTKNPLFLLFRNLDGLHDYIVKHNPTGAPLTKRSIMKLTPELLEPIHKGLVESVGKHSRRTSDLDWGATRLTNHHYSQTYTNAAGLPLVLGPWNYLTDVLNKLNFNQYSDYMKLWRVHKDNLDRVLGYKLGGFLLPKLN